MIKDVRLAGYREFTSKAGKVLYLASWLEPYSQEEGKGAAGYTAFINENMSPVILENLGKTVKAYVSHNKGFHTIEVIE